MNSKTLGVTLVLFAALGFGISGDTPQTPADSLHPADWPTSNGYGSAKYSPLTQITPANVSQLEVAWEYALGTSGTSNVSPIMIDNVLYVSSTSNTTLTALKADSGEEIWSTDIQSIPGLDESVMTRRGVSYWPGTSQHTPRIVLTTASGFLVQLDAATGAAIPGPAGVINLSVGIMDKFGGNWPVATAPAIYKNIAIVAGRTGEQGRYGIPGDPRGFDLLTGEQVWRFHVVPRPDEDNFGTWGEDGWQDRRGGGVWVPMTVDEDNGLVFIGTGNATDQNFGGPRLGENLYMTTLLALHAETGTLAWHFQHAYHDIYDWDTSSAATLLDTYVDGQAVPSVAQATKQGLLFVLNRLTGEPIWGVEDIPVQATDAPGDEAWPTQPYPIKPVGLTRDSMDRDEVWSAYTEAHTQYCTELYDRSVQAGPHTVYGMVPSLVFPGSEGGPHWGGVAADPERELMFVLTRDLGVIAQLQSRTSDMGTPSFGKTKVPTTFYTGPDGYPCNEPPWTQLFAISTRTGDVRWQVPTGEYAELTAMGITGTGTASNDGGPMVTAGGLVFMGVTNDRKFRAYDALTGDVVWSADMEANVMAIPVGYLGADGRQYVLAVAAGNANDAFDIPQRPAGIPKIVAFSLPR
jgi:quinoprotein glucose dehydrogenase